MGVLPQGEGAIAGGGLAMGVELAAAAVGLAHRGVEAASRANFSADWRMDWRARITFNARTQDE